jgi:hypothetical protein
MHKVVVDVGSKRARDTPEVRSQSKVPSLFPNHNQSFRNRFVIRLPAALHPIAGCHGIDVSYFIFIMS